jgi:WD40 repeat protein
MGTSLRLLDLRPDAFPEPLPGAGTTWAHGAEPSPDGRLLASTDADGVVRVWDLASRSLLWSVPGAAPRGRSVAWRPGGAQIAGVFAKGRLGVYDARTGSEVAAWTLADSDLTSLAYSPDGALVAVGQFSGPPLVVNAGTGALVREMEPGQTWVNGLGFSPDSRRLVAAGKGVGIGVYDVATGKRVAAVADSFQNWSARYAPDGSAIIACRSRPEIEVLDPATLTPLRTLRGHAGAVTHMDVDWEGGRAVSASVDGTLRLWDLATGHELLQLESPGEQVSWAAFVPGTRTIASCHQGGRVALWDLGRFDAMIAGSMSHMYARHTAAHGPPVDRERLERWARAVTGDAAFTLADPRDAVPMLPLPKDELEAARGAGPASAPSGGDAAGR